MKGIIEREQFEFVNILKCMAVLLILNSHYDSLYPIKALATGGALGNSLFFAITGYLSVNVRVPFKNWIAKKYGRIYIATIICTIFISLSNQFYFNIPDLIRTFIWPTNYWFIGALFIFYPLYYPIIQSDLLKNFRAITIVMAMLYAAYYIFLMDTSTWVIEAVGLNSIEGLFKLIFYFYIMLLGAAFRLGINRFPNISIKKSLLTAFIAVALMYIDKAAMTISILFMHLQFLNHVCILIFIIFLLPACFNLELSFKKTAKSKAYWIVKFISEHTLEIYLIQFWVIASMKTVVFPVNIIAATITAFILAALLKFITSQIVNLGKVLFKLSK